jgi:hypothetical protein
MIYKKNIVSSFIIGLILWYKIGLFQQNKLFHNENKNFNKIKTKTHQHKDTVDAIIA